MTAAETVQGAPALEMRNICKQYPGVRALDDVSLSVGQAEIHALLGENGAGKSTMMKILADPEAKDEVRAWAAWALGMLKVPQGTYNFNLVGYEIFGMTFALHLRMPIWF